jgi:hypothetical protein
VPGCPGSRIWMRPSLAEPSTSDAVFAHALGELLDVFFAFHLLLRREVHLLSFGLIARAGLLCRLDQARNLAAAGARAHLEHATAAGECRDFGVDTLFA